jgi:hypothetical protein
MDVPRIILQIGDAVRVGQKDILPVVATLRDVMSQTRYDDARDSRRDTGQQTPSCRSRNR